MDTKQDYLATMRRIAKLAEDRGFPWHADVLAHELKMQWIAQKKQESWQEFVAKQV